MVCREGSDIGISPLAEILLHRIRSRPSIKLAGVDVGRVLADHQSQLRRSRKQAQT